ncbi:hypothetical protein [Sphingomonas adhaesiva]|uniref:hypothetical protein n=1 Tax=Sphingomonas adhaesiva TaxID=28212 RepID=UPI002FF50B8A
MSHFFTRARLRRYGVQLVAGLAIGVTAGSLVAEAKAADTAASLLADPARLAAVQQGCKTDQPWATDAVCREAAQAIRLRFRGKGVPYHPPRGRSVREQAAAEPAAGEESGRAPGTPARPSPLTRANP